MAGLSPGLELDRLIATKVLGWRHENNEPANGLRCGWYSPDSPEEARILPNFSEDITAAWPLAERFRIGVVPFQRKFWLAYPEWLNHIQKCEATAPHAICLAVLAKMEAGNVEAA